MFISELNKIGIPYEYIDDWYDFEVLGQKVEVKSCRLSISDKTKPDKFRIGRFDFTDEENREKQYKANVWVCFILRDGDSYLLLGFVKAKLLNKKRYVPLNHLRELGLINLKDFVKIAQK